MCRSFLKNPLPQIPDPVSYTHLGFSNGITFTIAGTPITLTALAIAAIAGILLNIILPGNDYEFGVNEAGDENRGIHASTGKKNA